MHRGRPHDAAHVVASILLALVTMLAFAPVAARGTTVAAWRARLGTGGAAFGSIWAAADETQRIWRVDPATNGAVAIGPLSLIDDEYGSLAFGFGSVWANDTAGNVLRIDPATSTVSTIATLGGLQDIAVGGGSVWVSNRGSGGAADGTLTRIDPTTNRIAASIPVGTAPGAIAYGDGFMWVLLTGEPVVVQVDPGTNRVSARIPVGGVPWGPALTSRSLWVTVADAPGTDSTHAMLVRIGF